MLKRFLKKPIASFQERVCKVVTGIPRGKVLSYKKVAEFAGNPRAWRAVGKILNKNRDPKIPCHRVVKSDGKVGGYRKGINQKISQLKKEGLLLKKGEIIF